MRNGMTLMNYPTGGFLYSGIPFPHSLPVKTSKFSGCSNLQQDMFESDPPCCPKASRSDQKPPGKSCLLMQIPVSNLLGVSEFDDFSHRKCWV